jgi:hypothetical protein
VNGTHWANETRDELADGLQADKACEAISGAYRAQFQMSFEGFGILGLLTPHSGQRKVPGCMRPCSASHSRIVTPKRCSPSAVLSADGSTPWASRSRKDL